MALGFKLSLFCIAAAQSLYYSGPTRFSSPQATYLWPDLDSSLYFGYQSTIPAVDAKGSLYIADTTCDARCPCPSMTGYAVQPAYQQSSVLFKTAYPIPGWCVSPSALSLTSTSPVVLLPIPAVLLTAFPLGPNGTTGSGALGVLALSANGTFLWSTVLPASLPGLHAPTPVLNGTAVAVVTGQGPNITVIVLEGLTGKTMGTYGLPKSTPGCSDGLSALTDISVTSSSTAAGVWTDYLWLDGSTQPYKPCSMTWAVTGPAAGTVVYGIQPSIGSVSSVVPSLSPSGSPSTDPSLAESANGYIITINGSLAVTAVDPTTGANLWSVALPSGYSLVSGVSVCGPYMFLLVTYSQWRGCASPMAGLLALNISDGALLNSMRLTKYPDSGSQASGALVAAVDPSSCPGGDPSSPLCRTVNLWLRETLGWGAYNSYITAASFSGTYFLITTRYEGSAYGTNVAHDDGGQNPVRGCPPSVDATPGKTGALLLGQGSPSTQQPYMIVADWAGVQVFVDQQPPAHSEL